MKIEHVQHDQQFAFKKRICSIELNIWLVKSSMYSFLSDSTTFLFWKKEKCWAGKQVDGSWEVLKLSRMYRLITHNITYARLV